MKFLKSPLSPLSLDCKDKNFVIEKPRNLEISIYVYLDFYVGFLGFLV